MGTLGRIARVEEGRVEEGTLWLGGIGRGRGLGIARGKGSGAR